MSDHEYTNDELEAIYDEGFDGPHLSEADLEATYGTEALSHSARFRLVSTRYPHAVALAYDRDLAAAAAASDEEVAARVAQWELGNGKEPRDWVTIGQRERTS